MSDRPTTSGANRLYWPDGMKGVSILLIVFFHFFSAYDTGRYPWPFGIERFPSFIEQCEPSSFLETLACILEAVCASVLERGPHAVGVFIILSGFGLTYSLTIIGKPKGGWGEWYRKRLLRLFPMYWAAHAVYLISPFVQQRDAVDYRFMLSLMGDRIFPVEDMFYYLVPAWWFFGLLLQLYLVFPLLFRLLRLIRPARFLIVCALITMVTRYLLFAVLQANGKYVQGAFFAARLWEFGLGMAFAIYYRQSPALVERWLFSAPAFLGGVVIYVLGIFSYQPHLSYAWSDGLVATGFFIITAHVVKTTRAIPLLEATLRNVGIYSYGLYLLHQPYVIYLAERLKGVNMFIFLPCAAVSVAAITLGSMGIERLVNELTGRLISRLTAPLVPNRQAVSHCQEGAQSECRRD